MIKKWRWQKKTVRELEDNINRISQSEKQVKKNEQSRGLME